MSVLNSFPVCLAVGTALGFLSGLGVGGGSLLMVWLIAALGTDPDTARAMNLLFFLPAAFTACLFRLRKGLIPRKTVVPAALAGCAAAAAAAMLTKNTDLALLRRLFGGLLIVTGLRELCYRPR